jgi:hypothetical protein
VIESIGELKGLENLYFDTGAVTEAGATNALIRAFGPQKVRAIGLSAMRLQFSVPFAFPKKIGFIIQVSKTWCRYLQIYCNVLSV